MRTAVIREMPHFDTSPYAYDGVQNPYGGNDNTVESFCSCAEDERSQYDSIFGLGNKKKQAERKLKRAKKKLSKGKTKAAARLTGKANKLLDKIGAGQANTQAALQNLQTVNANQLALDQSTADANSILNPISVQQMSPVATANQPSTYPMPAAPSGAGGGGGDIPDYGSMIDTSSYNTGVESQASDEPTGNLADEKTLGGVTVTGTRKKKMNIAIVIGAAVIVLIAIIYFAKGKKGMKF